MEEIELNALNLRRGDVVFVKSDENNHPTGHEQWADRPAIIVSNNTGNKYSPLVTVIYMTSAKPARRWMPTQVAVHYNGNMSIAMCEQIYTVDKSRIPNRIGTILANEMQQIDNALSLAIGFGASSYSSATNLFHKWENYARSANLFEAATAATERETTQQQTDALVEKLTLTNKNLLSENTRMRQELTDYQISAAMKSSEPESAEPVESTKQAGPTEQAYHTSDSLIKDYKTLYILSQRKLKIVEDENQLLMNILGGTLK